MQVGAAPVQEKLLAPRPPVDFWSRLDKAHTAEQLSTAWLSILCEWLSGIKQGLLLLADSDNHFVPSARWPSDSGDLQFLADVSQRALSSRDAIIEKQPNGDVFAAYPLLGTERTYGCVVFVARPQSQEVLQQSLKLLHWGAGWLVGLFDRRIAIESSAKLEQVRQAFELQLAVIQEPSLREAAMACVNRLSVLCGAARASIGLADSPNSASGVTVQALSHASWFEARADLTQLLGSVMNEAFDQRKLLRNRQLSSETDTQAAASKSSSSSSSISSGTSILHDDFARASGCIAVLSVPIERDNDVVGVVTLEFDAEPTAGAVQLIQTISHTLGPAFEVKRSAEQSLWAHSQSSLGRVGQGLLGRRYAGYKLLGLMLAVLLVLSALIPISLRIRAPAVIEGEVQRAVVAPFDSFVRQAFVRAGDSVKTGQILAKLDDRELRLEETRFESEADVADKKFREAMSSGDAVNVQLASAQKAQVVAQLSLVREKLARVDLIAPFDGLVTKGDLSQQIGAPAELGKVLFEVAPLSAYRVIVKLDERDMSYLQVGQRGELLLSALPSQTFGVAIRRIIPMSSTENGKTFFRIEATPVVEPDRLSVLKPGMEGVAKINTTERSMLFVATRRLIDWLRLTVWEWGF